MHDIGRRGRLGCEDLMRELASIEHQLLKENSALAMSLMVLEAKLRERFQELEYRVIEKDPSYQNFPFFDADADLDDIHSLLPQELPPFPSIDDIEVTSKRQKAFETIVMAALLAVLTALGVFGLASLLHIGLSWIA